MCIQLNLILSIWPSTFTNYIWALFLTRNQRLGVLLLLSTVNCKNSVVCNLSSVIKSSIHGCNEVSVVLNNPPVAFA